MSKKTKFYAVKNGKKPGIYYTWEECLVQVDGYPNAIYKSFKTLDEANEFLTGKTTTKKVNITKDINNDIEDKISKLKNNEAIAFVDGSYMEDKDFRLVGFGILIIFNKEQTKLSGIVSNPDLLDFRNVTGEIFAAKNAITWAINHNVKTLTIYYDYEGIRSWALGKWKTNNELTTSYAAFIDVAKKDLKIKFEKVLAHSGIIYNEIVDELAKEAINRNK